MKVWSPHAISIKALVSYISLAVQAQAHAAPSYPVINVELRGCLHEHAEPL